MEMGEATISFTFGLDIIDHAIVEALRQALEGIMPDIMTDYGLLEREWLWTIPLECYNCAVEG